MTRVVWTMPALADLAAIETFVARDAPPYAAALVQRIIEAAGQLEDFPLFGRVVPEAKRPMIRELIVPPYRVLYRVKARCREILAIVHSAQDLRSMRPRPWRPR